MTFNWTVNLGQILQAVIFVFGVYGAVMRMYHLLDKRIFSVEEKLLDHAKTLNDHWERMDRYEAQILRVVGDLQRLIGRMEIFTDRRSKPRETVD